MMPTRLLLALVLCATCAVSGCSTVATLIGGTDPSRFDCDSEYTIPRIYSGVANDIRFIRSGCQDVGVVFWDLPFSLVADTLVLPYTCYTQARHGNLCTKQEGDDAGAAPE
jgi:uncharacterized protein YceK